MSERSASAPSAHIRPPQRTLTQQVTRFGTRLMLQSFRVRMQVGAFVLPRHTLQRACDVQLAASSAGALHGISAPARAQCVREAGPLEPAVCAAVYAALVRRLDQAGARYAE